MFNKNKIIFIVGPTATGKSKLAIKLAKKINGEIISCDSMQVYKGLDILSCKSSRKEMNRIRHHLIDIVQPKQYFNVNKFIKLSKKLIEQINNKDKVPILVGGTGLYIYSLLNGIFQGPAANFKIRKELYRKAHIYGSNFLHKKLRKIDPQAAEKIHHHDLRKIVRALEVYQITKKPISKLQKQRKGILDDRRFKIYIFGLNLPREKLYKNIDKRVDLMFRKGAIKETKRLLNQKSSQTFKQALGIKEINSYLKGEISLEQAKQLLKRNTRRFAKRQLTWFRKNPRIHWLNGDINFNLKDIMKNIV